jgi:hypothetical protein
MEGRAGRRWAFTGEASVTVGDGIFYGPTKWWGPPPAPLFLHMRGRQPYMEAEGNPPVLRVSRIYILLVYNLFDVIVF